MSCRDASTPRRWLRVAIIATATALAPIVFGCCRSAPEDVAVDTPGEVPESAPNSTPAAIFADVMQEAGIEFRHDNGATGELLLPEITGSGGALFDCDNDGDLDLYVVQGTALKPAADSSSADPLRDRLFRNDGIMDGVPRWKDVTDDSGIRALGYGMGVAAGDFNNDGTVDLYVTNLGSNQLWRNNADGTFTDVTAQAGVDDPRWSTSATFVDYDRDGWLDLFVVNYVDFSLDKKRECFSSTSALDYCGPSSYNPVPDRLFRNLGDGTFADVTEDAGISRFFGSGLGVVAADFNDDGWTDIYVANDGDPNQLWINQRRGGTFVDDAPFAGVAVNHEGMPEAGMGVDAGDFDGDGDEDLFMTHIERESNTFYVNLGDGLFEDATIRLGLHGPSLSYTAFGAGFFDYDNDGWLDLLVLNGAVRLIDELVRAGDPYPLHQKNQLYQNTGQAAFADVSQQAGDAFTKTSEVSRGAAFGDVDNDGDTDVVVFNNNGPTRLLVNQLGNRNHWLGLRLKEGESGRDSLHARVEVLVGENKQLMRRVRADGSYCSANDPRILIGLGGHDQPVSARVRWPDGSVESWRNLATKRYHELVKGQAAKAQ